MTKSIREFFRTLKVVLTLLCGFFLLNISKSFAEEINSWGELIRKGEIYYKKKGNIPYTGVLRNYFPTGEISLINNFKDGKQHGSFKSFHRNGNLAMEGQFLDGKQHGFWSEYYDNGKLYWKLEYIEGIAADGPFQMFHKNGQIKSEVVYSNGKPASNWMYYDEYGKKERVDIYEDGKFFYEKYF